MQYRLLGKWCHFGKRFMQKESLLRIYCGTGIMQQCSNAKTKVHKDRFGESDVGTGIRTQCSVMVN